MKTTTFLDAAMSFSIETSSNLQNNAHATISLFTVLACDASIDRHLCCFGR
jgi:hypothetical protein